MNIYRYLSFKSYIGRLIGLIFALGSGFLVGK